MEKKNDTVETIAGAMLAVGVILIGALFITHREEIKNEIKQITYENMSTVELRSKIKKLIKQDTTEAFLEAAKIRDVIQKRISEFKITKSA
jgi:protein-arginine kinase activator protein McsA